MEILIFACSLLSTNHWREKGTRRLTFHRVWQVSLLCVHRLVLERISWEEFVHVLEILALLANYLLRVSGPFAAVFSTYGEAIGLCLGASYQKVAFGPDLFSVICLCLWCLEMSQFARVNEGEL